MPQGWVSLVPCIILPEALGYHDNLKPPYQYFLNLKRVSYALYLNGTVYQTYIEHHITIINVYNYVLCIHVQYVLSEIPHSSRNVLSCVCVYVCVCAHQYYPARTPRAPVAYTLEHTATSRQYVTTAKKYVTLLLWFWVFTSLCLISVIFGNSVTASR